MNDNQELTALLTVFYLLYQKAQKPVYVWKERLRKGKDVKNHNLNTSWYLLYVAVKTNLVWT